MEVLNDRVSFLSNFEVLQLLKEKKASFTGPDQRNCAYIASETMKYLETTPCKDQTEESFCVLMKDLEQFALTKAEKVQIMNLMPKTPVEIQLIVEECEERMTIEDIDKLLDVISKSASKAQ